MSQGILIAIEGVDGAGKTTQQRLLCDAFGRSSESVVCSKEPTDGVWGRKIRASAQTGRMSIEDELHAFEQDRRQHVAEVIEPALAAGKLVILDRYFYSNAAYQGSSGADKHEILERMQSFAPIPDLVVFIDVPIQVGLVRISDSRMETPNQFERPEFLTQCRDAFLWMLTSQPNFVRVDGARAITEVNKAVMQAIFDGPIKRKRCRKSYDCDGMYCAFRQTGECAYARLRAELSVGGSF